MANVMIDGYNVIGVLYDDREAARKAFILEMSAYAKARGHAVTIVFDGWRDGPGFGSRSRQGGVDVVYSSLKQKADKVIRNLLEASKEHWIVVSSDREVQGYAWATDNVPVGSEAFTRAVHAAMRGDAWDDDEDEGDAPARGGGRRSKRDRTVARALSKL